ncbi:hypothetical protein C4572_03280 [Candidatus Parcubacteria bacterium]|nr:MAG: hypothetical protein C4572_03280 [Candidatus Parcubacteria bacterium]
MRKFSQFAGRYLKENYPAIFICLLFAGLAFFSASGFDFSNLKQSGNSITSDELPHIQSGYYYLKTGRFFLNPEHPPLAKDISAVLPLLILNPVFPEVSADYSETTEPAEKLFSKDLVFPRILEVENYQWDNRLFIFNENNNPDLILLFSRLSVIIANTFFLYLLYSVLKKLWSKRTASLGLALIAFSPLSLIHASLVTNDFMAAVLSMLAVGSFALLIRTKNSEQKNDPAGQFATRFNLAARLNLVAGLFLASAFLSLALLSKFSALILIPGLFAGGLFYAVFLARNGKKVWVNILIFLAKYAAVMILALSFTLLSYSFHAKNADSYGIKRQLGFNYSKRLPDSGKHIMMKMAEGGRFGKAAASYAIGLSMVLNRIDGAGQATYFLGEVHGSEGAGILYFPILTVTKIPAATVILTLLAIILILRSLLTSSSKNLLVKIRKLGAGSVLFVSFALFYAQNAVSSELNIGVRHFMPAILAAAILTARVVDLYWGRTVLRLKTGYVSGGAVFLAALATILSFPHYLSYYNILGGGTNNGYKIATDSNYDWGQDIKRLAKWVDENDVDKIYTHLFTVNPLDHYIGKERYEWFNIKDGKLPPPGSYIAVSAMEYQNNVYDENLPENKKYTMLRDNLIGRAGKSIFIFQIP